MTAARPPVPYIAVWSAEDHFREPDVIRGPNGIAYRDESPHDRDSMGVLWARRPLRRGVGRPRFGHVHPQRQRSAMLRLLCQVCGGLADQDERGTLWLLEDHRDVPGWPEDEVTANPPVCSACAALSARACPRLRHKGAVAIRVQHPDIDGVYGTRYAPDGPRVRAVEAVTVAYDDPEDPTASAWVLAAHMTRVLRGCTIVEPEQVVGRLRP